MPEQSNKLDHFTSAMLAEATAETERALKDLRRRHDDAIAAARNQIVLEVQEYIQAETKRVHAESGQRVSQHLLEIKRAVFLRRGEVAQQVFSQVRERIQAFTCTEDYPARLTGLFQSAADRLSGAGDLKVLLRAEDMPLAGQLSACIDQPVSFASGSFVLGGLIAESPALGLYIDSTFDTAIEELDGHFAELFGLSMSLE